MRPVALVQGLYYIVTGFLPVISMRTFEKVTGPKPEHWLVQTVGLLIGVIGAVLTSAGLRGRAAEPEISLLAVGSAASLASVDLVYWKRGTLPKVFLLDALGEIAFAAWWVAARGKRNAR